MRDCISHNISFQTGYCLIVALNMIVWFMIWQRQRLNAEPLRELKPFSNLVCEPSSGSSPVPGGTVMSCQQDGFKVATASSSGVKGKMTLEGPSAVMKDAERDPLIAADKETLRGGTTASTFNVMAQSSEAGLLSIRKPMPGMEDRPGFIRRNNSFCGDAENPVKLSINSQEDKIPERLSRKRRHDARTNSQFAAVQNSEPQIPLAMQSIVGDDSRATSRSQSWLQRWMPSSKPTGATGFKAPQSGGSTPSTAKNRRLVQDSNIVDGEQVEKAGSEQHTAMETGEDPSRARPHPDNHRHHNANPLFPGIYPGPSAAAMAIVGAASRRVVPLPPQRVGTRIAVWPAIAGFPLRRATTESESPEVLTPQVDVEVVIEEG